MNREELSFFEKSLIAVPAVVIPAVLFFSQETQAAPEETQDSSPETQAKQPQEAALVEAEPQKPKDNTTLTVTGGETNNGIAERYGLPVESVRRASGSDRLVAGQQIVLSRPAETPAPDVDEPEEDSSNNFEVTTPAIPSPSTPNNIPTTEQGPVEPAPVVNTTVTTTPEVSNSNVQIVPATNTQPTFISMPSISHTPATPEQAEPDSLDSNQASAQNNVESIVAPSAETVEMSNAVLSENPAANAYFSPPPQFTQSSSGRNFVAPRASRNDNFISSFANSAINLLDVEKLEDSPTQETASRQTGGNQPFEVITDVPTRISFEDGGLTIEVLANSNSNSSQSAPNGSSATPTVNQTTPESDPVITMPGDRTTTSQPGNIPPLTIDPGAIPGESTTQPENSSNNSSAPRKQLAEAVVVDFQAGGKPDITPLYQSIVQDPTYRAQPEGYYFMPQPLVVDGVPEYLFSNGTNRSEQRANPELIAVSLAVTEFASNLNGPEFVTEVGDLNSLYHKEHDGEKPAIDLRSRGMQDPEGSNNGPLFVETSPNRDLQKQYAMLQYLRRLHINGVPAVKYVMGYSDELLERANEDPEMRRTEARKKNFFLSEADHQEHWHIALNPAAFSRLPIADTGSCGEACGDNSPGITTYQQAIEQAQHVSVSSGIQGISYVDPASGNLSPNNDQPIEDSFQQNPTTVVDVQPALGSFLNRQVLTQAEYWLQQQAISAGVLPRGVVEISPVVEAPVAVSAPEVVTTVESTTENRYGMPAEAFALLSPEAQNYQVRTRAEVDAAVEVNGYRSGNLDVERAYGPAISYNDIYVLERFAGHSPIEAFLFTGIAGRESSARPASAGDFHNGHDGSYGLHSILTYNDKPNPLRDPTTNLSPWNNTLNAREMYLQSGLSPWETKDISEISEEQLYDAIRLGHRNNGRGEGASFEEHCRKAAQQAYAAYLQMEPLVSQALQGQEVLTA